MSGKDLTHLKPGDKIAVQKRSNSGWRHAPQVKNMIFTVTRTTATQFAAADRFGNETRFRRSDGQMVGNVYSNAKEATPELLDENAKELAELARWDAAVNATSGLFDRPLHQQSLSTAQLERLGEVWAEIKAMGGAS